MVAERGAGERAADRRAAHARHDEAGRGVPVLHDRRLHAPQRVAQVLRQGEHVAELI
jgi:hypothetical protein